ncbi:uncharacterized protein FPRN_15172 [Fusarium proliferatum]|nr:uncharacterized protein FPRN_15172 [Fusarium proliferatum]
MPRNSSRRKSRRRASSASQSTPESASPSATPPTSQDSPRPRSSRPTTPGPSGPQSPWSSGFEEQGVTGLPSPPASQSPSLGTSSPVNVALSSSGISTSSIEEHGPYRSATPIQDVDAAPSTTASQSSAKSFKAHPVEESLYPMIRILVAYYILFSGTIIICSTYLIGKTFDWIMQSRTTIQKTETDI